MSSSQTSAECHKFRDKTNPKRRLSLKPKLMLSGPLCVGHVHQRWGDATGLPGSLPVLKERRTRNAQQILCSPFLCESYLQTVWVENGVVHDYALNFAIIVIVISLRLLTIALILHCEYLSCLNQLGVPSICRFSYGFARVSQISAAIISRSRINQAPGALRPSQQI